VATSRPAHTTEKWALKNTLNIFGVDNFLLTLLFKPAERVAKRHLNRNHQERTLVRI